MQTLPAPTASGLVTQWTWQPVAVVAALLIGVWYLRAVRAQHRSGGSWPAGRSVIFGAGLAGFIWTTAGFLQVYRSSLYWAWTTQTLVLLLVMPMLLLLGQPLQLARLRSGGTGVVERFLRSGPGRFLANPLVGPALIVLLSTVLFFGPLPGWAIRSAAIGSTLQLLLVAIGGLVALPLVDIDQDPTSLAVGLALAIGTFELVLDAIPGIVLRLHTTIATSFFDHRAQHSWSPSHLRDQQTAGTVLWCVAEVLDLPFLLLVFRRWVQADARDAAAADAILEAERLARAGLRDPDAPEPAEGPSDAPWWLSDPTMQKRLRRRP
jgi:putative membrane protein